MTGSIGKNEEELAWVGQYGAAVTVTRVLAGWWMTVEVDPDTRAAAKQYASTDWPEPAEARVDFRQPVSERRDRHEQARSSRWCPSAAGCPVG